MRADGEDKATMLDCADGRRAKTFDWANGRHPERDAHAESRWSIRDAQRQRRSPTALLRRVFSGQKESCRGSTACIPN